MRQESNGTWGYKQHLAARPNGYRTFQFAMRCKARLPNCPRKRFANKRAFHKFCEDIIARKSYEDRQRITHHATRVLFHRYAPLLEQGMRPTKLREQLANFLDSFDMATITHVDIVGEGLLSLVCLVVASILTALYCPAQEWMKKQSGDWRTVSHFDGAIPGK